MKPIWTRLFVVALIVGLSVSFIPWPAHWAEGLYLHAFLPVVTKVTVPLVNSVKPSITAIALVLLLATVLVLLVSGGARQRRTAIGITSTTASVLVLLFPVTFGLGYRLPKLLQQPRTAAVALDEATRNQLAEQVLMNLQSSASLLSTGHFDTSAAAPTSQFSEDSVAAASRCVASLAADLRGGHHINLPQRVKLLPAGLQLRFGFAGIVLPWLLEPHIDGGLAPSAAMATALHELAHTAGFAAEAEAEAVGMVAGLECSDQRVVYAASLRLAAQLAATMPPEQRSAYVDRWPWRAHADLRAERAAMARYSSRLAPAFRNAYDLYLRSQGQVEGLNEYALGTELALKLFAGRQLDVGAPR